MSGKYIHKKAKSKKKTAKLVLIPAILVCLLIVAALLLMKNREDVPESAETVRNTDEVQIIRPTEPSRTTQKEDLEILDIGAYTGIYMEDGTDEIVSDVLMMKVKNNSADTVEYARFCLDVNGETAEFTVSALKPDATVVLLEKNRMPYSKDVDYAAVKPDCDNLAVMQHPLSLHEDKLSIQVLDGGVNVTNISDEDITGRVAIYYKNKAAGIYYGGITYRIILENGLKAGEIRQMMASHISDTGSEILFVTIAQ